MPCSPLLSGAPPVALIAAEMISLSFWSSVELGVMMPSPLNLVLAKIAMLSEESAVVMASASAFCRLVRICLAEASSCCPWSELVLISLRGTPSLARSRLSGLLMTDVSH